MLKIPNRLTVAGPNAKFLQWCNALRDAVEAVAPKQNHKSYLTTGPRGSTLTPKGGEKPPAETTAIRVRVKTERRTYLVCRELDGSTEGDTDIYVAKPSVLQNVSSRAIFYGRTLVHTPRTIAVASDAGRRTLTYGTTEYSEFTSPPYVTRTTQGATVYNENESIIYAERITEQSLGLTASEDGGATIEYIDKNLDSRKWVKEFETCVDNANTKQLVDISERYT